MYGVRRGYRGLQGVTGGYMELQGVTKGYRDYKGLQGVTGGYRGLQGVTGGYKLPKSLKSWFLKSSVVFYLKTVLMLTPETQIPLKGLNSWIFVSEIVRAVEF